jgi:hypothetical protein
MDPILAGFLVIFVGPFVLVIVGLVASNVAGNPDKTAR